jgi:hypothetical protein
LGAEPIAADADSPGGGGFKPEAEAVAWNALLEVVASAGAGSSPFSALALAAGAGDRSSSSVGSCLDACCVATGGCAEDCCWPSWRGDGCAGCEFDDTSAPGRDDDDLLCADLCTRKPNTRGT